MPCYPAFALLLGSALASETPWNAIGRRILAGIAIAAAVIIAVILVQVWSTPTPGDISQALTQHPEQYTLSLGHMGDLTLQSFAYLRLPLALAGIAALVGSLGIALYGQNTRRPFFAAALMMLIFFHAARIAMITFVSSPG